MLIAETTSVAVLWPDEDQGPWRLTFYWAAVDGELDVVGVDIRGFEGDIRDLKPDDVACLHRLSALILRQLPFRRLADRSWQTTRAFDRVLARHTSDPDQTLRALQATTPARAAKKGGRPRELEPEHFAEVARVYREAQARREHPTMAVAKRFGISRSTAGKRVARARSLRLLDPVRRPGREQRTGEGGDE